jgi:hypothetical protein
MLALVRRAILDDKDAAFGATIPTADGWPPALPDYFRKSIQATWETMINPGVKKNKKAK